MFLSLGKLTTQHPWKVVVVALSVLILALFYGKDVMRHLSLAPGWDVPGSGSALTTQHLRDQLDRDETMVIVLFRPKDNFTHQVDDPEYRDAVEDVLLGIARNPEVGAVHSYYTSADARLKSADGRMTYAVVPLARGEEEGIAAFERLRGQLRSDVLRVELGGELATYWDTRVQLEEDLHTAELLSFLALALLLLWVFGSPVAALLPLAVGFGTILLSVALLKLSTTVADVSVYTVNVVSMLGLGLAIDYALFILSRFREERGHGLTVEDSILRTLMTAGRTVTFSGVTVAASLSCVALLPQRFFENMALAGSISVVSAMLTSVVLLPSLLALMGDRVNQFALPVLARRARHQEEGGRWYNFSHFVMRHPWAVMLATLSVLMVIGTPVLRMQIGPSDAKSLPLQADSRRVQDTLANAFPSADLSPVFVTVRAAGGLHDPKVIGGLYDLTAAIEKLDGVRQVVALTTLDPGLTRTDYQLLYENPDQFPLAAQALAHLARDDYTLVYVNYDLDPIQPEARALVQRIRDIPRPDGLAEVQVGGFPAFHLDYLQTLGAGVPMVIAAIVAVICLLLFLMLGSVLVPVKVVLTNLLSLSATFGALVWIFQEGHLAGLLNFTPQGAMDGTILVLIFASAFGLAIDYEVFLLSRVKEICDATGDNIKAVSTGIQRSGPIITNAALLIGIVLGAFATGEVVFMKAMGLGLLLSVIVDATLVRMLLVPASLRLLGRLNWWAPKPLMMLYQRFNLSEVEAEKRLAKK
ncbi:MAG TPA: MMPL family transporter [Thiobacillaceae bacterium]|nr:MMPL family transporter [Thiobacillaceae bacterium]